MSNEVTFSGDKLRLARLLNGLTQNELGEKIYASRQFVHQLESDVRAPAADVLNTLYEVLHVTPEFFVRPLTNDVKFEQCHFRKRKTTPVGVANRVLAFSTIFEQLVTFVNKHLELPSANFPEVSHSGDRYSNLEIERAAKACRELWGLSDGPISNVTRALENAGVVITQFKGVSEKVDALSLNRKYPIIVRNEAKESICRLRFDLAHECGHFVLHDGIETGDNLTEREADLFASEFLFPKSAFLQEFPDFKGRRLDWKLIYHLKVRWGISVRALIYKAHYHDFLTAQQYRGANVWLNKTGQSKHERDDDKVRKEEPELLLGIFDALRDHLGIGFNKVADKLFIEPHMLSMITGVVYKIDENIENVIPVEFS
ncbi:helix-turn-helix domain-containing protein [Kiloniella sp.]|uniref:helix-turn-helix domain-containing protein n=1 Tax=Kiloniella sp. TaxID=1938587 RepID=UPI003A95D7BD